MSKETDAEKLKRKIEMEKLNKKRQKDADKEDLRRRQQEAKNRYLYGDEEDEKRNSAEDMDDQSHDENLRDEGNQQKNKTGFNNKDNQNDQDNQDEEKNDTDTDSDNQENTSDNENDAEETYSEDDNNQEDSGETAEKEESSSEERTSSKEKNTKQQKNSKNNKSSNNKNTPRPPKRKIGNNNIPKIDPNKGLGDNARDYRDQMMKNAMNKALNNTIKKPINALKNKIKKVVRKVLLKVLAWLAPVIIIAFIVIGILSFFLTMPGMVVDKIGEVMLGLKEHIGAYFEGSKAAEILVNRKQVCDVATYLDQMGYDLNGYGFLCSENNSDEYYTKKLTAKEKDNWYSCLNNIADWWSSSDENCSDYLKLEDFQDKTISERKQADSSGKYQEVYLRKYTDGDDDDTIKNNILMTKDEDGNITFAKSKYIAMYLASDNAEFLIKNYNEDFGERVASLFGKDDPLEGSGLIWFVKPSDLPSDFKLKDYIKNLPSNMKLADSESDILKFDKAEISKSTKQLRIYNTEERLWNKLFKTTYYDYNMDGWVSKYGVPLQLSLALHLSSLAPDFAYDVAARGLNETNVEMGLLETKGNSVKAKLLLDLGKGDGEKLYYIEEKITPFYSHVKSDDSGAVDSVCSTFKEAREELSKDGNSSGSKAQEEAEKIKEPTLMERLNQIDEELKQKTNDGQNKRVAGSLAFSVKGDDKKSSNYGDDAKDINNKIYDNNNKEKIEDLKTDISDEYIMEMRVLLEKNDYFILRGDLSMIDPHYAERVEQMGSNELYKSITNTKENDEELKKVKEIIKKYYTISSIDEITYVTISGNATSPGFVGVHQPNGGEYKIIKGLIENGEQLEDCKLEEKDKNPSGPEKDPTWGTTYQGHGIAIPEDTYLDPITILKGSGEGDKAENSGIIYGNKGDNVFVNSTIDEFIKLYFGDGIAKISNQSTIWEKVVDAVFGFNPFRQYYRLVDAETGEVVTSLTENKRGSDYVYVGNDQSYYADQRDNSDDDKGWFWRKSIPKELQDAINRGLDEDKKLSAKNVMELLDDMYEKTDESFTRYIPFIIKISGHWYQDIDFKGRYIWDTSEDAQIDRDYYTANDDDSDGTKKASAAKILYIEECAKGKLVEDSSKEPTLVGTAGSWIKNLIDNTPYYKFDGTGRSKEKSLIDFKDTAVDAIAMLEEIKGQDAQDIIRMFKELMATYNITFQATEATEYKKEIFMKVVEGYSNENALQTDGDDCVLKAHIPNVQEMGFTDGLNVLSPVVGKITYRSNDSVCIQILDDSKYNEYTVLISGFDVNDSVTVGTAVTEGTVLGKTKVHDIGLVLRDENGAIVKNSYVTLDSSTGNQVSGSGNNTSICASTYGTRTEASIMKAVDANRNMFPTEAEYNNIKTIMPALLKIQEEFDIDPLAALVVFHWESHCGTAYSADKPRIANVSQWNGEAHAAGTEGGFRYYESLYWAAYDFGNYVHNRFDQPLRTFGDLQNYNGMLIFEGAASSERIELYNKLVEAAK